MCEWSTSEWQDNGGSGNVIEYIHNPSSASKQELYSEQNDLVTLLYIFIAKLKKKTIKF